MEKFDFIRQFVNLDDKVELKDLLRLSDEEYRDWLNENLDKDNEQMSEF